MVTIHRHSHKPNRFLGTLLCYAFVLGKCFEALAWWGIWSWCLINDPGAPWMRAEATLVTSSVYRNYRELLYPLISVSRDDPFPQLWVTSNNYKVRVHLRLFSPQFISILILLSSRICFNQMCNQRAARSGRGLNPARSTSRFDSPARAASCARLPRPRCCAWMVLLNRMLLQLGRARPRVSEIGSAGPNNFLCVHSLWSQRQSRWGNQVSRRKAGGRGSVQGVRLYL